MPSGKSSKGNSLEPCEDSKTVTVNTKPCNVLIKESHQWCSVCNVQNICCKSCQPYKAMYNTC